MTALANPDLALLLLLAGLFLVYAEFNRPGTVLLGCLGALAVMLAFFGLAQLPLSLPAIVAAAAGVALLLTELRFPSRNLLASAGTVTLAAGLARLTPGIHIATGCLIAALFACVTLWLGRIALQARRNKFTPGSMPWVVDSPPSRPTR